MRQYAGASAAAAARSRGEVRLSVSTEALAQQRLFTVRPSGVLVLHVVSGEWRSEVKEASCGCRMRSGAAFQSMVAIGSRSMGGWKLRVGVMSIAPHQTQGN